MNHSLGTSNRRGMTLIELIVVVLILSSLAVAAVSAVGDLDGQGRFDDTRRRLDGIERAVLGVPGATLNGSPSGGGYVADIGALPVSLEALVANAGDDPIAPLAAIAPAFDPNPDPTSFENDGPPTGPGGVIELGAVGERLVKGWRGGYLSLGPGESTYRDGWGRDFELVEDLDAATITFTSLGRDGLAGFPSGDPFDGDLSLELNRPRWRVPLFASSWVVDATSVLASEGQTVQLALLVYSGGLWSTIPSTAYTVPAGQTLGGGGAPVVFTFPSATAGWDGYVPAGEHLFVLLEGQVGPTETAQPLLDSSGDRLTRRWFFRGLQQTGGALRFP